MILVVVGGVPGVVLVVAVVAAIDGRAGVGTDVAGLPT